jgi:predicted permease
MTPRIRPPSAQRLFRFVTRSADEIRDDVDDEFAFHLDMRIEDLMNAGLSEAEAEAQAQREFGDRVRGLRLCAQEGATVERQRTVRRLLSEVRQDAVFGARLFSRSPLFSMVAILTLALAIGGNTAIFSLVNALALKPLPVREPEEIVRVYTGESHTSWPNYQDIAARSEVFTDVAAHGSTAYALMTDDSSARLAGERTSTNYLAMLGVPAELGRIYVPSDARTDVVVLAERTWRTRFGSDPSMVGRRIALSGRQYEVLGVMPRGFRGARPPAFVSEFWTPIDPVVSGHAMRDRGRPSFQVVARLAPGVSTAQAQAATQIIAGQLAAEHPQSGDRLLRTEVFHIDSVAGFRGVTRTLAPLFAFVGVLTIVAGLVLLVGCANIAGLLLGRGAARRREIGVRLALGAGRGRLIRQLLTESLLLALVGGGAGILLAFWLTGSFNALVGRLPVAIELDLTLDRRMIAYTLVLSCLTAVLCGLAPARSATRLSVIPALKDDDPMPRHQRMRSWLVVGQVGLSCALLLWGGLFVRSLAHSHRIDFGFDPTDVLLATFHFDENTTQSGGVLPLLDNLRERTRGLPGVRSQGLATIVPLAFMGREEMRMRTGTDPMDQPGRWVLVNRVGPGWFQTVRIPVQAGRDFDARDRVGSPRVVIVNETLARRFWAGDALGKRLDGAEVIGIVRDSKYWTLGETVRPTVYTAYQQRPDSEVGVFLRTSDMAGTARALRAEAARLDPTMFVDVRPMSAAVSASLIPAQAGAAVTSAFGALGALLAMMGIYGLVAFTVAQRTREIGIRKAVGATTRDIVTLMVSGSAIPVGIGLVAGLLTGTLGAMALQSFIVGVSPVDPLTLTGTAVLVAGSTLAASALPALRAARVDPLRVLKME